MFSFLKKFNVRRLNQARLFSLTSAILCLMTCSSLQGTVEVKENPNLFSGRHHSQRGGGTIIPYAGPDAQNISTLATGVTDQVAVIDFGFSGDSITISPDGTIDLTQDPNSDNVAFSLSSDGILTGIAAYYSDVDTDQGQFSDSITATIQAQVYVSPTPNDIFIPLAGATVTLSPSFPDIFANDGVASGLTSNLNIPLKAGNRILFVFSMTSSESDGGITANGNFSGGLAIR